MKELFDDGYYADYAADEDQKPEFPDVDEELDIERTWDQYDPSANKIDTKEELHCEDPDFNVFIIYNLVSHIFHHIHIYVKGLIEMYLIADGCRLR